MRFVPRRLMAEDTTDAKESLCLTAVVLLLGLLLNGSTEVAGQNSVSGDIQGVAVTVEVEEGVVAPAIYLGTRADATANSGGDFHFDDVIDALHVMRPGTRWRVEEGVGHRGELGRSGLAIVIPLEDGSWLPGLFLGPQKLASEASRAWGEGRMLRLPNPEQALVLPEDNVRVRSIPLGMTVRALDPSQDR